MPVEESTEEGVPAQWTPQTLYDFRSMPDGPRGYKVRVTKKGHVGSKRRLDEYREQVRVCVVIVTCHVMHVFRVGMFRHHVLMYITYVFSIGGKRCDCE